ncbi:MAG: hypothetical protein ABI789_10650 [Usitatibacter sp.]
MSDARIIVTGGTSDKGYDVIEGELTLKETHLPAILGHRHHGAGPRARRLRRDERAHVFVERRPQGQAGGVFRAIRR